MADVAPIEVRATASKGHGVFASRDLEAGERIMAESVLVECLVQDARGTVYPAEAVQALDAPAMADFFELCQNAQYGPEKTARGIWLSNAYPTDDAPISKSAVFRIACRLNHACRPNAYQHWNESIRRMTLHALVGISRGEEVTVSYLGFGEGAPRAARQSALQSDFGFGCCCAQCALQGDALAQSDARQTRIHALGVRLRAPDADAVQLAEGRLRLLGKEGMLGTAWDTMFAAATYLQRSRQGGAAQWARRAAECARMTLGEDSPEFAEYSAVASGARDRYAHGKPKPKRGAKTSGGAAGQC